MEVPSYEVNLNTEALLPIIHEVLKSGWITQGPRVTALEDKWRRVTGQPHAVAVSSGQNALELSLRALYELWDVEPKTVVVQANAFVGDVSAVLRSGGQPLFVDVDDHMQIDVDAVRDGLPWAISGVIAVHIGGWISPRMGELRELCDRRGWFLIEDACHAHGAWLGNDPVGSWGDATVFSFYATKVVTCGEGGMIVTYHEDVETRARRYRCQGRESVNDLDAGVVAGDCRLSDILAAIALHQTGSLTTMIRERAVYAAMYDQVLSEAEDWKALRVDGCWPSWYKYIVVPRQGAADRVAVEEALFAEGINCPSPAYEFPVYEHSAFRHLAPSRICANAERLCSSHWCLPLFNGLRQERALYVQEAIRKILL